MSILLAVFLTSLGCSCCTSAEMKSDRNKRMGPQLETEEDVESYLRSKGKGVAILRCKTPVNIQWLTKVVPYLDVECETLGSVKSVQWFHGKNALETGTGKRLVSVARPHVKHGQYFERWLDYSLRIHKATEDDSGIYTIQVGGPNDEVEEHRVQVHIVTEYKLKSQSPAEKDSDPKVAAQVQRQRRLRKKSRRGKQFFL